MKRPACWILRDRIEQVLGLGVFAFVIVGNAVRARRTRTPFWFPWWGWPR